MKPTQASQGNGDAVATRETAAHASTDTAAPSDRMTKCVEEFCAALLETFAPRVENQEKGC